MPRRPCTVVAHANRPVRTDLPRRRDSAGMVATVLAPRVPAELSSRSTIPLHVLAGTMVGLAYGVSIRLWMRFISVDHEFTWTGTIFILGAFAVLGTSMGVAMVGRRRGWRSGLLVARTMGLVLALACFGAAGALMLPTMVTGGLAVGRFNWRRPWRLALAGLSLVSTALVATQAMPPGRKVIAYAMYLGLCVVEASMLATLVAPSDHRSLALPRPVLRTLRVGVPALAALVVFARTVGS